MSDYKIRLFSFLDRKEKSPKQVQWQCKTVLMRYGYSECTKTCDDSKEPVALKFDRNPQSAVGLRLGACHDTICCDARRGFLDQLTGKAYNHKNLLALLNFTIDPQVQAGRA